MKDIYGTAIYPKNIGMLERSLRLGAALGVALIPWLTQVSPGLMWAALGTGATLSLTAVFGFCPACYLAGRRTAR